MKSQGQSQKTASNTLGEELKRALREELTQNFPAEIAAQIQGEKPAPQEILPGQSINPAEKESQEQKHPFIPSFYQEESPFILKESATEIETKISIQNLRQEIQKEKETSRIKITTTDQSVGKGREQQKYEEIFCVFISGQDRFSTSMIIVNYTTHDDFLRTLKR